MRRDTNESIKSTYESMLTHCLIVTKKAATKRDKTFNTNLQTAIDMLMENKDVERNANKFFPLLKQGIELHNKKVTEIILQTIRVKHIS